MNREEIVCQTGGKPAAIAVAEKLTHAYMLACNSDYIVCDVVDGGKEMTKQKINLLRDYLPDIESDLNEVIVALMGHTFAEVE